MNNQTALTPRYKLSTYSRQILKCGREHGWKFNYLGKAPLPRQAMYLGDWLIIPAHQDNSIIPERAMERIRTIYATGYRPAGWIVVHEAPKLLEPPKTTRPERPKLWKYLAFLGGAAALGGIAATIIPLLGAAAVVDPILILVTPEMDWIEIDRWFV